MPITVDSLTGLYIGLTTCVIESWRHRGQHFTLCTDDILPRWRWRHSHRQWCCN